MKEKDVKRLGKSLQGIKDMTELPAALFIIDPSNEMTAIAEARRVGISVVAVCDTNTDPDLIDYPIPGNDDAIRAIKLITSLIADAILQGKQQADQEELQGVASQEEGSSESVDAAAVVESSETVPS